MQFCVEDTGCGMDEVTAARCCEPYVSAEQRDGGGSGLGLYICRASVEAMGGNLTVESEVGKGTKVTFVLSLEVSRGNKARRTSSITDFDRRSSGAVSSRVSVSCSAQIPSTQNAYPKLLKLNPDVFGRHVVPSLRALLTIET